MSAPASPGTGPEGPEAPQPRATRATSRSVRMGAGYARGAGNVTGLPAARVGAHVGSVAAVVPTDLHRPAPAVVLTSRNRRARSGLGRWAASGARLVWIEHAGTHRARRKRERFERRPVGASAPLRVSAAHVGFSHRHGGVMRVLVLRGVVPTVAQAHRRRCGRHEACVGGRSGGLSGRHVGHSASRPPFAEGHADHRGERDQTERTNREERNGAVL